jgi:hypothetical protein
MVTAAVLSSVALACAGRGTAEILEVSETSRVGPSSSLIAAGGVGSVGRLEPGHGAGVLGRADKVMKKGFLLRCILVAIGTFRPFALSAAMSATGT